MTRTIKYIHALRLCGLAVRVFCSRNTALVSIIYFVRGDVHTYTCIHTRIYIYRYNIVRKNILQSETARDIVPTFVFLPNSFFAINIYVLYTDTAGAQTALSPIHLEARFCVLHALCTLYYVLHAYTVFNTFNRSKCFVSFSRNNILGLSARLMRCENRSKEFVRSIPCVLYVLLHTRV